MDCEFRSEELVPGLNWVVDIGQATSTLNKVLSKYNYNNLDDLPQFLNQNTTTEFMCKQVFDDMCAQYKGHFGGQICIKLSESHVAFASYTGNIH